MKKLLISIILIFWFLPLQAQNLFYIGNKSYPSTEKVLLNSASLRNENGLGLKISFARDNNKGLLVAEMQTVAGVRIKGNLLIYLNDGTVINCIDRNIYDYVNNIATTVYYLTIQEITKMKNSNINTIRYNLKCMKCGISIEEGSFTAENRNHFQQKNPFIPKETFLINGKDIEVTPVYRLIDFPELIKSLFKD